MAGSLLKEEVRTRFSKGGDTGTWTHILDLTYPAQDFNTIRAAGSWAHT